MTQSRENVITVSLVLLVSFPCYRQFLNKNTISKNILDINITLIVLSQADNRFYPFQLECCVTMQISKGLNCNLS